MDRRQFVIASIVAPIFPLQIFKGMPSPVPGKMIPGRMQNRGKLIPQIRWACMGVLREVPWMEPGNFTLDIKKVWGEHHCWPKGVKAGDTYMPCATSAFIDQPVVGAMALVTTEHYVTVRGHDQYRYVGRILRCR